MKRKFYFIIAFALLAVMLLPAAALADTANVFDQADLLSFEQEDSLQHSIDAFKGEYNADMVIVTTTDAEGKTSREYADDYFDFNGFGMGSDKSGILFLINMDARETYISTSGTMIDILSDDRTGDLLDAQTPYLQDGDYYGALALSIDRTGGYMAAGPVAGQYRQPENGLSPLWMVISILIGAGVGGLVVLIIYKTYKKEYKTVPYDYQNQAKLNLKTKQDTLVDTRVTSRYIPPPDSGSGSGSLGGRSSTHTSSSGRTHGGGGRGF